MLKKNLRNILIVIGLSLCFIYPVYATEETRTTETTEEITEGSAEDSTAESTEECAEDSAEDNPENSTEDSVEDSKEETGDSTEDGSAEDKTDNDVTIVLPDTSNKSEYALYRNQLKAQLCHHQIEYVDAFHTGKQELYEIAKTKFELGYITEVELKRAEMQVASAVLQSDTAKEQLQFYMESIELRGGVYRDDLLLKEIPQLSKDYTSDFLTKSSQMISYNQQITVYENKLTSEDLSEEEKQQINLQLAKLKENKRSYEIELTEYVKQLQLQYTTISRQIQQYDNEIALVQLELQNMRVLLENGKIAKATLTEKEVELKRLEYERLSNVSDAQLILYILEHTVESQTV